MVYEAETKKKLFHRLLLVHGLETSPGVTAISDLSLWKKFLRLQTKVNTIVVAIQECVGWLEIHAISATG